MNLGFQLTVLRSFSISCESCFLNLLPTLMKLSLPEAAALLSANMLCSKSLLLSEIRNWREACKASLFFSINWLCGKHSANIRIRNYSLGYPLFFFPPAKQEKFTFTNQFTCTIIFNYFHLNGGTFTLDHNILTITMELTKDLKMSNLRHKSLYKKKQMLTVV